jgi:hypothetical protein
MAYEPPLLITIPVPSEMPIGYGVNSTGHRGGNIRFRCTDAEFDAIKVQADLAGLSFAAYCRWICIHVADKMRLHREENSTDIEAKDDRDGVGLNTTNSS